MSGRYAIDASVWNRLHLPKVVDRVSRLVDDALLTISDQARLEILLSTRTDAEYRI